MKVKKKHWYFAAFFLILIFAAFFFRNQIGLSIAGSTLGKQCGSTWNSQANSWVFDYQCKGADYDVNYAPLPNVRLENVCNPACSAHSQTAICDGTNFFLLAQSYNLSINDVNFGTIRWYDMGLKNPSCTVVENPAWGAGGAYINDPTVPLGTDSYSGGKLNLFMENDKIKLLGDWQAWNDPRTNQFQANPFRLDSIVLKGNYVKLQLAKTQCNLDAGDFVVGETFVAGTSVSISSFRYPVKSFCFSNPILVTDSATMTSYQSKQEYASLVAGQTIVVPAGKTMTFFYVLHQTADLPIVSSCSQGFWDAKTQSCVVNITTGFIYLCSQGQFDPAKGACVVQPESVYVCPDGGRYDISQSKCIINPPSATVCPPDYTYESMTNRCIFYAPNATVCVAGATYSNGQCITTLQGTPVCSQGTWNGQACVYTPETQTVCTIGTYDSFLKKCIVNPETTTGNGGKVDYEIYLGLAVLVFLMVIGYWQLIRKK